VRYRVFPFEGNALPPSNFSINFTPIKMSIKNHHKKKSESNKNPSASVVVYQGKIRSMKEMNQVETATVYAGQITTLSSSVGGALAAVFGSAPSSTGDWANLVATWHEFRTLGFEVNFQPINKYNYSVTKRPIAYVVDHTDVGTLSGYAGAGNHESCVLKALDDSHVVKARMSGTEEAEFQSTASPTSAYYIKYYADGLSFSQDYMMAHLIYKVQFRGRK
jgi:hypothetical protein